ncbi:hypothetical protein SAMN05444387_3535 [Flavobacterium pectinovorum]|uniref:Uncharacterized protein n=1 Tax=Flavobacterium pectinovorum TaxID=29533 RepID=A0ABY1J6S0_9FLAO|nr:hypothetical protein SAMN05444387_3535 [Flavobacterium pectinovorum]
MVFFYAKNLAQNTNIKKSQISKHSVYEIWDFYIITLICKPNTSN